MLNIEEGTTQLPVLFSLNKGRYVDCRGSVRSNYLSYFLWIDVDI